LPDPPCLTAGNSTIMHGASSAAPQWQRRKVFFLHFRKSGGTSVVHAFRTLLDPQHKLTMYPNARNGNPWDHHHHHGDAAAAPPSIVPLWRFDDAALATFADHVDTLGVNFVACEWGMPDPCHLPSYCLITVLRDPFHRFTSEFKFRDKFTQYNAATGRYEPEVRDGKASEWQMHSLFWNRDHGEPFAVSINKDNYFVRQLCGLSERPDLTMTDEHLQEAKRRLRHFEAVLVLEQPQSHALLLRTGWNVTSLPHANTGAARGGLDAASLMDIERAQFVQANALDYELYEYAKQQSEQQSEQQSDHLI
jgi:hypothetical protein